MFDGPLVNIDILSGRITVSITNIDLLQAEVFMKKMALLLYDINYLFNNLNSLKSISRT